MSKTDLTRDSGARKRDHALTEAKLALVAARERGDRDALKRALHEHPTWADALTEFDLGLMATAGYADEANAPDVLEVAQAAQARAFEKVFGVQAAIATTAQPAAAAAALSLKALRQARGQSLTALAGLLGLGMDVLSALEGGRIRVASVPQRLYAALADALDATAEQISGALSLTAAPALRRGQPGAAAAANKQLDFTEAVMMSQSMTQEQQAHWLAESAGE